jgi:Ca2+-binding EF-hand superfamily protein
MPDGLFAKLDTSQDGALSKGELSSFKPLQFGRGQEEGKAKHLPGDANQDGVVTMQHHPRLPTEVTTWIR